MWFEFVRWGLPNFGAVVALASVPLISLAMSGHEPIRFETAESYELDAVNVQIVTRECTAGDNIDDPRRPFGESAAGWW
jgi:hypothetical protein